jgi:hypothetical protein
VNEPLQRAIAGLRAAFVDPDVVASGGLALVDGLSPDVVWELVLGGELERCTPRLMELMVKGAPVGPAPWRVLAVLAAGGWPTWNTGRRRAFTHLLDVWWATALEIHPFSPEVDEFLAALAQLDEPLVRWLQPLLESLDGAGAEHLADLVMSGLRSPGWEQVPDRRSQVLGWCRTEPVVIGLTLVGGVHLAEGRLGNALDVMLGLGD